MIKSECTNCRYRTNDASDGYCVIPNDRVEWIDTVKIYGMNLNGVHFHVMPKTRIGSCSYRWEKDK